MSQDMELRLLWVNLSVFSHVLTPPEFIHDHPIVQATESNPLAQPLCQCKGLMAGFMSGHQPNPLISARWLCGSSPCPRRRCQCGAKQWLHSLYTDGLDQTRLYTRHQWEFPPLPLYRMQGPPGETTGGFGRAVYSIGSTFSWVNSETGPCTWRQGETKKKEADHSRLVGSSHREPSLALCDDLEVWDGGGKEA